MLQKSLQDTPPFSGYSPDQERALGGYAILTAAFLALTGAFSAWFHRSGRELPERVGAADVALMTLATYKLSRLITKDRATSAVRAPFTRFERDDGPGQVAEAARGRGLRRAVGELLVCPYCLSLWIAAAFAAGLAVAPRATRWVAAVFAVLFGSDVLQLAYKRAENAV